MRVSVPRSEANMWSIKREGGKEGEEERRGEGWLRQRRSSSSSSSWVARESTFGREEGRKKE